jgi:hypothetical protein
MLLLPLQMLSLPLLPIANINNHTMTKFRG